MTDFLASDYDFWKALDSDHAGYNTKKERYPALEGFWMAGQWVETWGGITTAAQSGRNAVRAMCKKDGVSFAR